MSLSFRPSFVALACVAAGSLLISSGCGNSKAARAQTPPPQSLSEPIRAPEDTPAEAPAIPQSADQDAYTAQKPGESRELPLFREPDPRTLPIPVASKPAPAPAWTPAPSTPVPVASSSSASGTYHTLAKGETLYGVARKYNVKPKHLIEANKFKDPNHLAVGTKVYVPVN